MSSRESLIDEVFTLRNLLAREKREHEETQRELAQLTAYVEHLAEKLEAITEEQEEPYV